MRLSGTIKQTFYLYLAQIVNLFLGWVVTRLNITHLSVSEYGQLSFFITAVNVSYVFFTLGIFESASRLMALEKSEREYRRLLAATLVLTAGVYGAFALFFRVSAPLFRHYFQVPIHALMISLFPLAGAYLLNNAVQMSLRGAGRIGKLSVYTFTPRLFYAVVLGILVVLNRFTLKASAGFNLGSILLISLIFVGWESPDFRGWRESLRRLLREIKRFGIHIFWSEIIRVFLYHTDKLMISFFLSSEQLAFYALAYTVTFPLSFFSTALSTSSYKNFSTAERISPRLLWVNLVWIVGTVSVFILLRKLIILRLFSPHYAPSLQVFPILAIAFGVAGLTRLFSYFLTARGEGIAIRNISVMVLAVHLLLNATFIPWLGIRGAAWAAFITYLVDLLLCLYYYRKHRIIRRGGR